MLKRIGLSLLGILVATSIQAGGAKVNLKHVDFDQSDVHSLQRGAKWFMNYCSGCHGLSYMRYKSLGEGIQLFNEDDELDEKILKANLVFPEHKVGDLMTNAMPAVDSKDWFGKAPPDLTLEARVRGSDWIYNFLLGFYYDPSKPRNVNNSVFPDVGMPHILQPLEGIKIPIFEHHGDHKELQFLQPMVQGSMTEHQYEAMVYDLVNFLTYVAEPMKQTRIWIGWFAMAFLIVFTSLAYLMKKAFWEDVH